MTDSQPQDENSPENGDLGVVSEQELDDVLAQASELADELSDEVGAALNPAGPDEAHQALDAASDLDADLSELEQLVAGASKEVGEGSEPSGEEELPQEQPETTTEGSAVPDFMAEFTRPEDTNDSPATGGETAQPPGPADAELEPDASAQTTESTQASTPAKPGVVGTGMIGVVGAASTEPTADATSGASEELEARETPPAEATVTPLDRLFGLVEERVSPIALKVCEKAVPVLEAIDKPFGRVGTPIRRVIGWVAIATMGTALIVFLVSLF